MHARERGWLVALVAGLLLLSYPLINIPNQPVLVLGLPVLYLYVFALWLSCIGVAWMLSGRDE